MRILIITNLFEEFTIGGYEIGCRNFVKYCKELGNEVTVLTTQLETSTALVSFEKRELKLHENWGFKQVKTSSRCEVERHNINVIKKYSEQNYDKIFMWNGDGLGVKLFNFLLKDPRVIFYFMDRSFFRYKRYYEIKSLLKTLRSHRSNIKFENMVEKPNNRDQLIFCSKSLADQYGYQKGRIAYPGYNQFHGFEVLKENSTLKKLVYVGQLTQQKGIYKLIKYLRSFNENDTNNDLTLTVYAKHINSDFVEDDVVKFKYGMSYDNILAELPYYDLAVFPSIWEEPFGFVMAEYADAGLPILTSARGGSKEIYNSNDLYIFDPSNYDSFVAALQQIINSDAKKLFSARVSNKEKLNQLKWSNLFEH